MKSIYLWLKNAGWAVQLAIALLVVCLIGGSVPRSRRAVMKLALMLDISPNAASINAATQQQFTVTESFAQNPTGTWNTTCGTIDQNGLYTAPPVNAVPQDTQCKISFTNTQTGQVATVAITILATLDGPAELPRAKVASAMADTPAPGNVTLVATSANLQSALNNAQCGDTLQLQAGVTFTGNFTLVAKSCDDQHWVVLRTSASDSALPTEGVRLNPCYAGVAALPGRPAFLCSVTSGVTAKIVAPKNTPALTLAAGANHYRIGPGLEITRAPGSGLNFGLIVPAAAADHVVVDRDWIHGTAQDETTRGVFLSGVTTAAVVDSYLNDFHCVASIGSCADAQAISGGTGTLPQGIWKISGNFLEASTEVVLFGGVLKNSTTPADIIITNNHFFKPLTWMPGQAGFVGGKETATAKCPLWDPTGTIGQCPFVVKNLFELKNAQRLLLEGNILENTWPGFTQHGNAILLSGLNPPGSSSTISIADVTLRYNRVAHASSGLVIANMATGTVPNLPVERVSIHDMIFDDLSPAYANGDKSITAAMPFQLNNCQTCIPLTDISIRHNTLLLQVPKMGFILGSYAPALMPDIDFSNNLLSVIPGMAVTSPSGTVCLGATNLARLNNCFAAPYTFAGNVLISGTGGWPAGNFFPANPFVVGFTNYNGGNGGDYSLQVTSPYKGKGTDGQDPGANVSVVNQTIVGVQ